MNIYYINLDSAHARRANIEQNLGAFAGRDFEIKRVQAYDTCFVEKNGIHGTIRPAEKACFLSHIKAIKMSCEDPGPSLIVEDDVISARRQSIC